MKESTHRPPRPPRWGWRFGFLAVWLLLTASWLWLPHLGPEGATRNIPFVEISLFQTRSTVVVTPSTDEAFALRLLREIISNSESEMAEIDRKLEQPVPPEYRNRSLSEIFIGPRTPRRTWLYQRSDARQRRDEAEITHYRLLPEHLDAMRALEREADAAVNANREWSSLYGPLTSFAQPAAPLLVSGFYVARTPLLIFAALGFLPLFAALIQSNTLRGRDTHQMPDPRAPTSPAATEATLAAAGGRIMHRPHWRLRLGIGLSVTIAGFLIAHVATTDRTLQLQIRASDDLRFRVENNCFLLGYFVDDDFRSNFRKTGKFGGTRSTPAMRKAGHYLWGYLWNYEPAHALRQVSQRALRRGTAVLDDGFQTVLALGGWVAGLPGLIFLIPILSGLITEARMSARRRRGVCAACAYPLFGLPEPRCPECGTEVSGKRRRAAQT